MKATGAATAAAGLGATGAAVDGKGSTRIEELVEAMTLEQKVGQMTQVAIDDLGEGFDPETAFNDHDDADDGATATLTVGKTASVTDPEPTPDRYDIDGDGNEDFGDVMELYRRLKHRSRRR